MKILRKRHQGSWILRIIGPLARDQHLEMVRDAVADLVERRQRRLILDLSGVAYVDAAGLGELIRCDRQTRSGGGFLALAGPRGNVLHVLHLSRVGDRIRMADCVEDAVRMLQRARRRGVQQARRSGTGRHALVGPPSRGPAIIRRTNEGPWRFTPIHG